MREALHAATEFERGTERVSGTERAGGTADDSGFLRAVRALAARKDARNPAVTGSVLALAAMADGKDGRSPDAADGATPGGDPVSGSATSAAVLVRAVRGSLGGVALEGAERVAVLRGALAADPAALWSVPGLLDAVDEVIGGFGEDEFLDALPDLRLAFTALNPRETDRMAEELAARHGAGGLDLVRGGEGVAIGEATRGAAIDAAIERAMRADGLAAWLEEGT